MMWGPVALDNASSLREATTQAIVTIPGARRTFGRAHVVLPAYNEAACLPPLRSRIHAGADVVICSRFTGGGDDATAPPLRRLLSRGAALLFRHALQLSGVRDFTSGFRAYRVTLLRRAAHHWGERLVEEQGFACMVEL